MEKNILTVKKAVLIFFVFALLLLYLLHLLKQNQQHVLNIHIKNNRTSVVIFYLDDNSSSKEFAPVVSGLKLLWTSSIDLIPLTTDDIQGKEIEGEMDPAYYWHGKIPQTVVIDGDGEVQLDQDGQHHHLAIHHNHTGNHL